MPELLGRLEAFLLAPAEPARAQAPLPATPRARLLASRALVLGTPATALPVAAALANDLRAGSRARAAVVCAWAPGGEPLRGSAGRERGAGASRDQAAAALTAAHSDSDAAGAVVGPSDGALSTRASRRLAGRLRGRGVAAVARGRLACAELDGDAEQVLAAVQRAAACTDDPTVLAIAGPRPDAIEASLGEHDLVVLAPPPGAAEDLLRLAHAGLGHHPRVLCCERPPTGLARWRALAGLSRLGGLRTIEETLDETEAAAA